MKPTSDYLSEETKRFLRKWSEAELTKLSHPFQETVFAKDLWMCYMPACDGTVIMFHKSDNHSDCIRIDGNIINVRRETGKFEPLYLIQ